MSLDTFETERLVARRPRVSDFSTFRGIHTDAGTMKTLSADGSLLTEEQSQAVVDRHLKHWDARGFGIWLFSTKSDSNSVGYCGLRNYVL